MAFGAGGPGGHGGHGGGPGLGGPGAGGPGFGWGGHGHGLGFGRFGFGHFGPSRSFSGMGGRGVHRSKGDPFFAEFPDNIIVDERLGTAQERVEGFMLNCNSRARAKRWEFGLGIAMIVIAIGQFLCASQVSWVWIFMVSPSILLSPLVYALRNLFCVSFGSQRTRWLTALACLLSLIGLVVVIGTGGAVRTYLASVLGFGVGSLAGIEIFQISRRAKAITGYSNDRATYRMNCLSVARLGRLVELLVFVPVAFAGKLDLLTMFWFGVCALGISFLVELVLNLVACRAWDWLDYHLDAHNDYIVDEPD